ncbi:MAG TPA: helix-turn-helix domain-containing protein, partial [Thermoanaerobaculia bacterium]|nr:helix-turn-helix domain-containing protein [Thermoanaerobaculia bacterium]
SDIPLLARHLLDGIARRHNVEPPRLEDAAAELLVEETWPGNVRELANVLERAVILADGPVIRSADLRPLLRPLTGSGERDRLKQALTEADGDKRQAAEILGMSYRVLLRKVKEHDLEGVPKYRD